MMNMRDIMLLVENKNNIVSVSVIDKAISEFIKLDLIDDETLLCVLQDYSERDLTIDTTDFDIVYKTWIRDCIDNAANIVSRCIKMARLNCGEK